MPQPRPLAAYVILAALLTSLACTGVCRATPVLVSGTVVDATQNPIPNASIRIFEHVDQNGSGTLDVYDAVTDASGNFSATLPSSAGVYDIIIQADGHALLHHARAYTPSSCLSHTFLLHASPTSARATVSVVDASTGGPLPGVIIADSRYINAILGVTDSSGQAPITINRSATAATVMAVVSGRQSEPATINFEGPAPHTATIIMAGAAINLLSGSLLDAQNQPIQASAYRLSLHSTATPYSLHPSVDSTGAFRVSHMPYGSFEAVLSIPDAVYLQTINVPAGTTAPFNIAFTETATATAILTGLARDKVESPLEGVVLQLHRRSLSGDLHLVKETKTTALGQYSFTQLPPGSYSLSLLRGGAQLPQLLDLSVQPGTNVVNITSGPTEYVGPKTATAYSGPHTVTGSVRNTADSLVQGAVVWVTPADSETIIVSATTTTAGTYTLSGLADGDYSLYAANHDASGVRHLMLDGPHPLTICGSNIQAPDVVLHAPHAILARIATLDSSGRLAALSGATVTITEVGSSPPETQSTTTDDWGTAVFSTLSQTQYTVTVTKTGFTSRSKTVDLSTLPASPDGFSLLTIDIILVEDS